MNEPRKEYPILFLGGAKRVSIGRKIAEAFRTRGHEARIYSYETDRRVPIAAIGEVIVGRRWKDADLYTHLREAVEAKGIRMIVPFVDGAVGVAAEFASRYPELGVFVPGTSAEMAELMFDKCRSAELFERLGLPTPASYRGEEAYPLIAKPRHGSASKGIRILSTHGDLAELENPEDYLIQEYIEDAEEISTDCYASVRTGEPLVVSPRIRLETLGGEAVRSLTIDSPEAEALARKTLTATGLKGAVTIQFIRSRRAPERLMIMEINPRLGGGVVCSAGAGADIPGCIADEALGFDARPSKAVPGTEMCRYFEDVIFKP